LVPTLHYRIHQERSCLPTIDFDLTHHGGAPAINARVTIDIHVDGHLCNSDKTHGLYRGNLLWNLNPGEGVRGLLHVDNATTHKDKDVVAGVHIEIIDVYRRSHHLLPVSYILLPDRKGWFLEPVDPKMAASQWALRRRFAQGVQ